MTPEQEEECSKLIADQLAGFDETVTITTASLAIVLRKMFLDGVNSEMDMS